MASTAFDATKGGMRMQDEGSPVGRVSAMNDREVEKAILDSLTDRLSSKPAYDSTHRRLKSRHIQLIGIGGTIGTALFVQIGQPLIQGGPGSLFIAFTLWCTFILAITICKTSLETDVRKKLVQQHGSNMPTLQTLSYNLLLKGVMFADCMAEMVTYLPISSPFIRFAGRYVDEAFGVAAGYNFFILEVMLVPFEIVACNLIIRYWSDIVPTGGMIATILVIYAFINLFAVKWYGESEFWLALGKVVLAVGLILYTFITMVGGNPLHDRFGFRYWEDPGAFAEIYSTGSLGRFLGFMVCLVFASYTISGPDYVSMAAGEAENPRAVMPRAYNKVFGRLTAFFVLGSLAVGINVPYNSQEISDAINNGKPGAAASPYVIAMNRLRIGVLPDIVNALVFSASFSAGNSYVYCASRSLYGLALEGRAPRILTRCMKNGVPIYCVIIVLLISLISFLQVSNGTATVLKWFISVITASQLINFSVVAFTYTRFKKACEAQGLSRDNLPYKGRWQPFLAWYALSGCLIMALLNGFTVFIHGNWQITSFFFSYTMVGVFPLLYFGWKILKRTKIIKPENVDLRKDVEEIEEYTRNFVPSPPSNTFEKILNFLFD